MGNNYKNDKGFDRSIAFTFYAEWAQDADTIEEDYGLEGKAKFYDAIVNYALFEITPEMKPPIKYFWNTIQEKIDASQNHRARGFTRENTEQTEAILKYIEENPNASEREIAVAVGCSNGKVNKVKQKYLSTTNTSTNTTTSSSTTVSVSVSTHGSQEEKKRDLKDLTDEEVKEISEKIDNGERYIDVQKQYNLSCKVSKETPNKCREIVQEREAVQKRKQIDNEIGDLYDRLAAYIGCERSEYSDNYCIELVGKCGVDAISRYLNNPTATYEEICERYNSAPAYAREYETLEERIKNFDYINNLKESKLNNNVNNTNLSIFNSLPSRVEESSL